MNCFTSLRVGAGVMALALAGVGCGKIPGEPPPPLTGNATLVVTHDDDSPVVGAMVVHTTSDGTHIEDLETDGEGRVDIDITVGDIAHVGFVESVPDGTSSKRLYSVLGLEVNDEVHLNNRLPAVAQQDLARIDVTVPPLPMSATSAQVSLGCTSATITDPALTTVTVTLQEACLDSDGTYSVVVTALDASLATVSATVQLGIEPPVPGQVGTVSMPAWAEASANTVSLEITNLSEGAVSLGELHAYRGAVRFESFEFSADTQAGSSKTVRLASDYADSIMYSARASFPNASDPALGGGILLMGGRQGYDATGGNHVVADMSQGMARVFSSSYDAGAASFAWMVQADLDEQLARLEGADIMTIVLSYGDSVDPTAARPHRWQILAPAYVGSPIELDVHALAELGPTEDLGVLPTVVGFVEVDVVPGYQDMKKLVGTNVFEGIDQLESFEAMAAVSADIQ